MIEIRIHGRGGQGAVIASKVLAVALFAEGKYVQSFPKFGVERRGAPVEAFLRIDDDKILIRNNIYTPDHIVVLDPTLIDAVDVTTGLAKGGWIIINSPKTPDQFPALSDYKIACVDASAIAIKYRLGARSAPIVNTAICGAFASATKMVGLKAIQEAILEEVPIKAEANSEAAKLAFEQTAV